MISQPSALPTPEMNAVDTQFMAEERSLQEQHARAAAQIADQIAEIQRELTAAQIDMDKRHQAERTSFDRRKTVLAAELGQAHSDHLAAQELVLDRESRLSLLGWATHVGPLCDLGTSRAGCRGQWPFRVKAYSLSLSPL